jgi:hypothetical protein
MKQRILEIHHITTIIIIAEVNILLFIEYAHFIMHIYIINTALVGFARGWTVLPHVNLSNHAPP